MSEIIDIEANLPHSISEVICLKCLDRWIAVYPNNASNLKKFECKNRHVGFIIKTGQEIND